MVGDAMKTIKVILYERITSPLLGAFMLSWCLWNFRFLIVIFSSLPVTDKFNIIDTTIFPTQAATLLRGLVYPLMTTVFFIYVYPYPAKKVYEFWRSRQKELKEIRQKIEDEEPLSKEEAKMIRSEMYRIKKAHQEELAKRDEEITLLREADALLNKEKESSYVPNEHSIFLLELSELQKYKKEVLHVFSMFNDDSENPESKLIRDLAAKFDSTKVVSEFILGELVQKNLMIKEYSQEWTEYVYKLTHKGRRTALLLGVGKMRPVASEDE